MLFLIPEGRLLLTSVISRIQGIHSSGNSNDSDNGKCSAKSGFSYLMEEGPLVKMDSRCWIWKIKAARKH